jgi:tRNA1(Val) A37 N6-methylase TrmN6
MSLTKKEFSSYIKQFQFREMFNDMGWNNDRTTQPIVIDTDTYTIQSVGEKSGFKILICQPQSGGLIPDTITRKKIDTKVTKLFQEHLIIFFDAKKTEQIWQLIVRQSGKPTKVTETRYHINQDPELLFQRASGIFFELDEEENITIIDVTKRIAENFHQNNERVTKQFYDKFKKEHTSFLTFIEGIDDKMNKDWYASLMLNRLMFCYFIQKKGFLNQDKDYLRTRLKACQEKKGKDKFYSFYRNFLLSLFHFGLGAPNHNEELKKEIGKIPYLNGGLFDEHELETTYNEINIDDKAFENLFDFFDQYEWHLDTTIAASGKDINPDVIGYIFEKYINDRANMGAYYTKEDITDYISKNCILPFLFEETKRNHPEAFDVNREIWSAVKNNGDNYIYDAVKKGVEHSLPNEIEIGLNDVSKRTNWNKPAPITHALPTEIWREVISRRNRYNEIKSKIEAGEIGSINDFITYNLNIRQFVQDVVEDTTDAEFLKQFYQALNNVTIIDPTCGSGAFLFAAMNILEPLYESCLQRMENFIAEAPKGKYKYFEETIAKVKSPEHPNLQYFIYKTIILKNLYGVDIMKEAVEIAKLRLFLKLVATVEADYRKPNLGLEPLPDVDFNIRAGNTLVGFATDAELQKGLNYTFDGVTAKPTIEKKCNIVANAFSKYKEIQLSDGDNYVEFKKAKEELNKRLKELNHELNQLLHKQAQAIPYEKWLASHQPFHWFAEYYEIIQDRVGFDVIIGNPPYVEYAKVRGTYQLKEYETERCSNLYGFVIERSNNILNNNGLMGMIIPISAFSNSSMESLQKYVKKFPLTYISNFHQRPAALFEGVLQRLSIFISYKKSKKIKTYSTNVFRWKTQNRDLLFPSISYIELENNSQNNSLKLGSLIELEIFKKFQKQKSIQSLISRSKVNKNTISYRTAGGGYWVTILNEPFETNSLSNKNTSIFKEFNSKVISAVLNSNLFWWYYTINFDQFNFKDYMIFGFNFSYPTNKILEEKLINLSDKLEVELLQNCHTYIINSKTRGSNETITYNKFYSKKTMDNIDTLLAEHYGFTDEELDFIINYDIKYRMGKELDNEEE